MPKTGGILEKTGKPTGTEQGVQISGRYSGLGGQSAWDGQAEHK